MELSYKEKYEEIEKIKKYLQRSKQLLISQRIGEGDYVDNAVIIKLTSIIVTCIELMRIYKECEINELDSVMDKLMELTPEFYILAEKVLEINEESNKKSISSRNIQRHSKRKDEPKLSEAIKFKRNLLIDKQKVIAIKDDEKDHYFGDNKKPL